MKSPLAFKAVSLISLIIGGFFIFIPSVFAQSTSVSVVYQSSNNCSTSATPGSCRQNGFSDHAIFGLGDGWSGTTTETGILQYSDGGDSGTHNLTIVFTGYTDSSYSSATGQSCTMVHNFPIGFAVATTSAFLFYSTGDCNFQPSVYYEAIFTCNLGASIGCYYQGSDDTTATPHDFNTDGSNRWLQFTSRAIPQFATYGTLGSYTPTVADQGVSTSTAQSYCNSSFSTSTNILDSVGSSIGNGFCQVGVFLFFPSQDSIYQYTNLLPALQSKLPFSYYFDVSNIIYGQSASTTSNFPVYSSPLGATGVASTTPWSAILSPNYTLLSSSTIVAYIGVDTFNFIQLLMISAIWVEVALHLYHRIRPHHITHV